MTEVFPPLLGPDGVYRLVPESEEEAELLADERVRIALAVGEPRRGHPEGVLGLHVQRQWEYIERSSLPGRREQRLIALLHDLGKNLLADGGRAGEGSVRIGHAERSARFAEKVGLEPAVAEIIRLHDENWYAFQRWRKSGELDHRALADSYEGVDLAVLVPFKYADNCDRELFPVFWFEHRLVEAGSYERPYYLQNPAVIAENNIVRATTRPY